MTNPRIGKSPTVNYDIAKLTSAEQKILQQVFHKDWFITFAKEMPEWKKVNCRFVFARPNAELSSRFRLNRDLETLIIFLQSTFDNRTPDFVDRLMEGPQTWEDKDNEDDTKIGIFKNRLDPRKIILISQDKEIYQKVELYQKSHPQGRIFIPYTYGELLQESTSNAWERFKKQTYGQDLFAYEQPVLNDIYFFGREDVVAELANRCEGNLNSGVFGLRRVGKTSVLHALKRKLHADKRGIAFYFPCYKPSFYNSRWWEVLRLIAESILNNNLSSDYSEQNADDAFKRDLQRASKKYKTKIVLIFDEIESFMYELSDAEHWKTGKDYVEFWQTVRAIQQESPDLFTYVLCGVNPTALEKHTIGSYTNPIFSGLNPIYLPPFNYVQIREMIQTIGEYMGLTLDEEIFSHMEKDYGGHPFLIRMACSKLHEKTLHHGRPYHVETSTYVETKDEIDDKLFPNIKQILEMLETHYPTEYLLLDYVVNDEQNIDSYLMQYRDEILHLLNYNIIKKGAGNKLFLTIKAMEKYLQKPTFPSVKKASSLSKKPLIEGVISSDVEKTFVPSTTTIHIGTFQGVLGNIANSGELTQNLELSINAISKGDFESLQNALKKLGIEQDDINELKAAVESEPETTKSEKFGEKVSAWIGKMIQKAASGSWDIGIAVAGNILATVITKYYGF